MQDILRHIFDREPGRNKETQPILVGRGCNVDWSPDGKRMAYILPTSNDNEIWVMNVDGSGATQVSALSMNPGRENWEAVYGYGSRVCWSREGDRLAYGGYKGTYIINLDGTGCHRLTENDAGECMAWSPNGEYLAVGDFQTIVVVDRTGREVLRVGDGVGPRCTNVSWSPDSRFIAYSCNGINIAGLDGKTEKLVSYGERPTWQPENNRIAFSTSFIRFKTPDGGVTPPNGVDWGVHFIEPNLEIKHQFGLDVTNLVWSRGGSRLLVTGSKRGQKGLFVVEAGSKKPRHVLDAQISDPAWSPLGDEIAYHVSGGQIYRLKV